MSYESVQKSSVARSCGCVTSSMMDGIFIQSSSFRGMKNTQISLKKQTKQKPNRADPMTTNCHESAKLQ